MQTLGPYQLTVFTSPNPLRAGPMDVSILVQDAETGQPVRDAKVTVELASPERSLPPLRAVATTAAATNKLLRAALFELPASGRWDVRVECRPPDNSKSLATGFTMEAAPPLPEWLTVWPWFCWPIVAVVLFVIHRVLVARRTLRRAPSSEYAYASVPRFARATS